MKAVALPFSGCGYSFSSSSSSSPSSSSSSFKIVIVMAKNNKSQSSSPKEFQKRISSRPKPATSYRRKKVEREDLPEDTELYSDPTTTLYYTHQGLDNAVPVLLIDGHNVCGYWPKLKKHFMGGRLDVARQKLVDELLTFCALREVKVVVVFDAMLSGSLHTRKLLLVLI